MNDALDALKAARASLAKPNGPLAPAYKRLAEDAAKAREQRPLSVLDKKKGLAGADPHDYVSYAPYFWPDPSKPGGLPFVRKDGQRNREQVALGDQDGAGAVKRAISALGLSCFFDPRPSDAERARLLLRTWFLDPKTRMNPNLNHGQAVPGGVPGRKEGVIEWRDLAPMLTSLTVLEASPIWTDADRREMRGWLTEFYAWLSASKLGVAERNARNNHGCWYDVLALALAQHLGKGADAQKIIQNFQKRVEKQIAPDGRLPEELSRADSWGYSTFALTAMLHVCTLAERYGVELWSGADGRRLRSALDYLVPFALEGKTWPHENDPAHKVEPGKLALPLLLAARGFNDAGYRKALERLPKPDWETLRERLLIAR